jgi:tetratricopeptide (TPR) repeat protein
MKNALSVSYVVLMACSFAAAGEGKNLLEDGASFEVGIDGFSLNNCYLLSHHGHEIAPVFDDSTAVHGKYSLRLDNPLGDKIVLAFRPIRVEKSCAVTVSGYLKGTGKAKVQLMRWPFAPVASADVDLTPDWQRFHFPATVKDDQNYFLWIVPSVETSRIWLDAIQIEEGELGGFHPKALEISAATTAPYNTYWVGDDCALTVRLYTARPAESASLSIKVLDIFRNTVLNKTVEIAFQGQNHAVATTPLFHGDCRGSYKVFVEARQGQLVQRKVFTFAVLKAVDKPDPFFGFNLKQVFNEDSERRYRDNNQQMELVYANAPLEYTLGLMRKVGAASLRCFRTAEYPRIEKPSGEFVWRDAYLDLQRQAGLETPLVVLYAKGPPRDADPNFPGNREGRHGYFASMEAYQRYVRVMVEHYKGKVRYYEVVNEPETVFKDVQTYVDRLKAAHDVIRQVDPEARIVAPSYSGGRPYTWIEEFCKCGGHRWVNIWAIHYAGRTLPERGMDRTTLTWEVIRKYREILVRANAGVDKPFWNTEGGSFYWSPEYDAWPIAADQDHLDIAGEHYLVPNEPLVAAYTPRLQLLEKAAGLAREYSFEFGFYYSQNASKATDVSSMFINYDGTPSPALVTYNAVADIFAGSRPVELRTLAEHVVATVFDRDGRTVAAVWKGAPVNQYPGFEKYDCPVFVDLKLDPRAISLMNMLGHPLACDARPGGLRLTATANPLYFTSQLTPAQVLAALRDASVSAGPRPQIDAPPEDLIRDGQFEAAIAVLRGEIARNPKNARLLELLGTSQLSLKDTVHAMESFQKALELDPDSARANVGMAQCIRADNDSKVLWGHRMAKAAEYMGKGLQGTIERIQRSGRGEYADLADLYDYFYLLQVSTQVPGNAGKALALIPVVRMIDPQAKNFRTQRMLAAEEQLRKRKR